MRLKKTVHCVFTFGGYPLTLQFRRVPRIRKLRNRKRYRRRRVSETWTRRNPAKPDAAIIRSRYYRRHFITAMLRWRA